MKGSVEADSLVTFGFILINISLAAAIFPTIANDMKTVLTEQKVNNEALEIANLLSMADNAPNEAKLIYNFPSDARYDVMIKKDGYVVVKTGNRQATSESFVNIGQEFTKDNAKSLTITKRIEEEKSIISVSGIAPSNLYVSPATSNPNSDITVTATADTGCTNVQITSTGFSNCRDLRCCDNPTNDGNKYGWSWTCTSSGTPDDYTAYFRADQSECPTSRAFTVSGVVVPPPPVGNVQAKIIQIAKELGLDQNGQRFVLKLAAVESGGGRISNIAHCKDGTNNCGRDSIDKIKSDGLGSYGIFQLNVIHESWFTREGAKNYGCVNDETAYDSDCNIRIGIQFLKSNYDKPYPGYGYVYPCTGNEYRYWKASARWHNGWATDCSALSQGQINYVELVEAVDTSQYECLITGGC
ncbi:MAG: hypothetical protein HYW24_01445 [Candidatus Aenigmarchaeota archaeon]|nr:hypothetical protein [Candidatus Aenigmarchaeota archaeon]